MHHTHKYFISGGNVFTIDLWQEDSDPFLMAIQFFVSVGYVFCVQVAKLFLTEIEPQLDDLLTANTTTEGKLVFYHHANVTDVERTFESDVENVYFIVGALSIMGTIMQIILWLYSGCLLSHWSQDTDWSAQTSSLKNAQCYKLSKQHLLAASFLLCFYVFVSIIIGSNFVSFGIIFTANTLKWTKSAGSNLVTVVFVSELVSKCVSIVCTKFVHVNKLMIASTFLCLGGTLFMTLCLHMTSFSLWIGASLLGLGFGNMLANSLNTGKQLTSQTGVMVSFILTSGFSGQMVAPLVTGYLMDNVDVMWFLYLGVVCSCFGLLLLVSYLVLLCSQKDDSLEQECDVPLEIKTPEA